MMKRLLVLAVFCLGMAGRLPAQDPAALHTVIIPPPLEGTVSLGVFDAQGKCVRVLAKDSPQDKIPAALNGWAISWDGKLADGRAAPAGTYEIHGVIVGEVKIEGVAWHFNDWIDSEHPADAPVGIADAKLLPDGGFLLLYYKPWIELARFGSDGASRWIGPCNLEVNSMTVGPDKVTLFGGQVFQDFSLDKGAYLNDGEQHIWSTPLTGLGARVIWRGKLLAAQGNQVVEVVNETSAATVVATFPTTIRHLAASGNQIAVSDGTKLFLWKGGEPEILPVDADGEVLDLTFGGENTLWWIAQRPEGRSLHSLNLADGKDRELVPDQASNTMSSLSVSADDHTVAWLNRDQQTVTFRILQLSDPPPGQKPERDQAVSYWKTLLERRITQCGEYGIDEKGELVATGKIDKYQTLQIKLQENPLNPGVLPNLNLKPTSQDGGIWISTNDGLPLFPVALDVTSQRLAIAASRQPDSVRVFVLQSVGIPGSIVQPAGVAEYQITGLPKIMTCTSGPLQWPPGPTLPPDELHVPSAAPASTPE